MPAEVSPVFEATHRAPQAPPRDHWIARIAWLLDASIPLGPWRLGIDSLIGFVPGVGDLAGALLSMIIVIRAINAGVPQIAVTRMMANVAIDSLLGAIPVIGDVFDIAYKSNLKNLRIYEESMNGGHQRTAHHWGFMAAILIVAALLTAAPFALIAALMR